MLAARTDSGQALAVLRLVEEELVGIDGPLARHLDERLFAPLCRTGTTSATDRHAPFDDRLPARSDRE